MLPWRELITPPFCPYLAQACHVVDLLYMYITKNLITVSIETGSMERGLGQEKNMC